MRPLTPLERERLITRIAQGLAWIGAHEFQRNDYRRTARQLVEDLEDVAVHGATDKRAAEAILRAVKTEVPA